MKTVACYPWTLTAALLRFLPAKCCGLKFFLDKEPTIQGDPGITVADQFGTRYLIAVSVLPPAAGR